MEKTQKLKKLQIKKAKPKITKKYENKKRKN